MTIAMALLPCTSRGPDASKTRVQLAEERQIDGYGLVLAARARARARVKDAHSRAAHRRR